MVDGRLLKSSHALVTGHTPSPPPLHEWLFIAQIAAAAGAGGEEEGRGGRGGYLSGGERRAVGLSLSLLLLSSLVTPQTTE